MLSPTPFAFKAMMELSALPKLSGFTVLAINGVDAAAFLQAQTMNDVLALAPGQWQWNGWLNPKGRVIALFALLRSAENEFLAVLPDFPASELLPRLQRFIFRAKVTLSVAEDWACAADFDGHSFDEIGWTLDFSGEGGSRSLRLLGANSELLSLSDPAMDARWFEQDIAHGLPRLAGDQIEAWTPQMLSLDRLKAYSLRKGCYPGQEIVARTHYLGQAKRQLVRLRGTWLHAGLEVRDDAGHSLGTLICTNCHGNDGLAVMAIAAGTAHVGEASPVTALPLLSGLQRPL